MIEEDAQHHEMVRSVSKELLDKYFAGRDMEEACNILAATISRVVETDTQVIHLIAAMARANVGLAHEAWTAAQADEYVDAVAAVLDAAAMLTTPITKH